MSTLKSSAEDLTLNADGSGNDIIFQSNGSTVATLDQAGTLTATTFTGAATDSTKLPTAGGTMTGQISFGDNVHAKFGASDDLDIYHSTTGNHSYIHETGGGDLIIKGANVLIHGTDGGKLGKFVSHSWAGLFYNNSEKLRTTSTGIDVTGNIDLDNGSEIKFGGTAEYIHASTANNYIRFLLIVQKV